MFKQRIKRKTQAAEGLAEQVKTERTAVETEGLSVELTCDVVLLIEVFDLKNGSYQDNS